jgi:hypothetical protein
MKIRIALAALFVVIALLGVACGGYGGGDGTTPGNGTTTSSGGNGY